MEEKTTAILVCMYMTWNLFLLLALGHYYTEANFVLKMRNISFYKSLLTITSTTENNKTI